MQWKGERYACVRRRAEPGSRGGQDAGERTGRRAAAAVIALRTGARYSRGFARRPGRAGDPESAAGRRRPPVSGGSPHAESIRTEGHLFVDRLYIRADPVLTQTPDSTVSSARDSAVKAVAHGAHTIEMAGHYVARTPADVNPLAVLAVANEFIATNQLPNYLRAGCCEEVLAARAFVDPADRVVGSGPGRGFVAQARRHCLRDRIGSRRLGDGISGAGGDSVRDHDSGRAGTETGRR